MIEWVFLDVGNIILDEDYLTFHVFQRHVQAIRRIRPHLSFFDLLAERQSIASQGSRWPLFELASKYLDARGVAKTWDDVDEEIRRDFSRFNPPIDGIREVVERLSRDYALGLIANQPRECREHLRRLGLLDSFRVVALSEEQGATKPHPELFRIAMENAGVSSDVCLMVGDRVENDVVPAASLGMLTIWVEWPSREAKGWDGGGLEGSEYLRVLHECSDRCAEKATRTVATVRELPAMIDCMNGSRARDPRK